MSSESKVGERGIPLPATTHLGVWTIDTGYDGETTVTGPAPLRFTKPDGQRIYHYEVIHWLRRNRDIARSGGTVDLTTGAFHADTARDSLAAVRDRLIRDQAALIEAKAAAHCGNDTTAEALLYGQLAGIAVALRYIAEEAAR